MKYKLLQKLPWLEIGMILEELQDIHPYSVEWYVSSVFAKKYPDFFEEVKEPKTIYDLKKGDKYYEVYANLQINSNIYNWHSQVTFNMFLTEREAKRNKLLRELATRTSKHLPKKWENYIWTTWISRIWQDLDYQILDYNIGLVFYGDDDYNSFMTDENKKLLFEI